MAFGRKTQFEIIPGHSITVDAEDLERVQACKWEMMCGERPGTARFYTNIGAPGRPAFQLLAAFILGVKPTQYVEQVVQGSDYRKKNLKKG